MSLTKIELCENCNADEGDITRCRVTLGMNRLIDGEYENARYFDHQLCEACADCIACLDFAAFRKRHDNRPRELKLP